MLKIVFLGCFAVLISACKRGEVETDAAEKRVVERDLPETMTTEWDESEMDRAIAKARATVGEFLEVLESGEADEFSVKAPVSDENGTEHFWVTDVSYADGVFKGLIGNDPGVVKNVKFGDVWEVKREDISDWLYMRGEKLHGGYTIEVLLNSFPKDEAEKMRASLVR